MSFCFRCQSENLRAQGAPPAPAVPVQLSGAPHGPGPHASPRGRQPLLQRRRSRAALQLPSSLPSHRPMSQSSLSPSPGRFPVARAAPMAKGENAHLMRTKQLPLQIVI